MDDIDKRLKEYVFKHKEELFTPKQIAKELSIPVGEAGFALIRAVTEGYLIKEVPEPGIPNLVKDFKFNPDWKDNG